MNFDLWATFKLSWQCWPLREQRTGVGGTSNSHCVLTELYFVSTLLLTKVTTANNKASAWPTSKSLSIQFLFFFGRTCKWISLWHFVVAELQSTEQLQFDVTFMSQSSTCSSPDVQLFNSWPQSFHSLHKKYCLAFNCCWSQPAVALFSKNYWSLSKRRIFKQIASLLIHTTPAWLDVYCH